MKSVESQTAIPGSDESCTKVLHSGAQFMAARDSRNRRVSGLCTRNGRFYAVLWANRRDGRKGCAAFRCSTKPGSPSVTKNGKQLRDYLHFLAFTGAREQEALRVRWAHVDFERARVFIGALDSFEAAEFTIGEGGTPKNSGSRVIVFDHLIYLRDQAKLRRPILNQAHVSNESAPSPEAVVKRSAQFRMSNVKL
jgi:hypothetical protein